MANKRPKQSTDFTKADSQAFSVFLQELLAQIGWTQKKLAERSGLSTTKVSRIVNNRNSRNGEFNLEFDMIVRLSIGLEMGEKGLLLLLRAAYPTIFSALNNRETFLVFISRLEEEKERAEKAKK